MRNLSLPLKLYLGFGIVVLLLALMAANSLWSVSSLISSSQISSQTDQYKAFLLAKEIDHYKWLTAVESLFLENKDKLEVQIDPHKCGLGKFLYGEQAKQMASTDPRLASLLEEIKKPHAQLHQSAKNIGDVWRQNHQGLNLVLAQRLDDHRQWAEKVAVAVINNKDAEVQLDPALCAFGKWLESDGTKNLAASWQEFGQLVEKIKEPHKRLHASAAELNNTDDPLRRKEIFETKTTSSLAEVAAIIGQIQQLEGSLDQAQHQAKEIFTDQTLPALAATQAKMNQMSEILAQQSTAANLELAARGEQSQILALVIGVCGIAAGILLAFFITRSIVRPINHVVESLNMGADQVGAASEEVSSSSNSLAEGSSEQAASLEETSASLRRSTP